MPKKIASFYVQFATAAEADDFPYILAWERFNNIGNANITDVLSTDHPCVVNVLVRGADTSEIPIFRARYHAVRTTLSTGLRQVYPLRAAA